MKKRLLTVMLAGLCAYHATVLSARADEAADAVQKTPEERDARMKWWREARFGMFIFSKIHDWIVKKDWV